MRFFTFSPEPGVFITVQAGGDEVAARRVRPYLMDKTIRGDQFGEVSVAVGNRLMSEVMAGVEEAGGMGMPVAGSTNAPTAAPAQSRAASTARVAAVEANAILTRLDVIAGDIQKNPGRFGFDATAAAGVIANLDKAADAIEAGAFGTESLEHRKAEVMQKETDEPYMDAFQNPQAPHQTEPDEPYMAEFNTDTSGEVRRVASDARRNPFNG